MAPLDGKSIGSDQKKKSLKGELMIFRTKMQARDQCRVQLKDSIHIEFLFCELEKDFALQGESCT
jgi:hypothetical protein